jgi:protein-tyrosine phosphatase
VSPGHFNLSWITPELAVGGSFAIERAEALARDFGVSAVVDLRAEACDDEAVLRRCGVTLLHLPTEDHCAVSKPMLAEGVAFVRARLDTGERVLVHCEHGIGRSALLALCVLVDGGLRPLDALRRAKDARELLSPSSAQYEAWAAWLRARGLEPPPFDAFAAVAYRHLA